MPELVIATTATAAPMGAQAYEAAIASRASAALSADGRPWQVRRSVARSLRSPLPGNLRLPMGWLFGASPAARARLGAFVYPKDAVVHRMDLVLPPPPGPHVVTLHDVVAWKFDDESDPVRAAVEELRAADAVICVSKHTAHDASELLGIQNTTVIPNGVHEDYFDAQPLAEATRRAWGLTNPYVLYAGGSAARKNLPALAEAWRRLAPLRRDWQLALAGPTNPAREALFADCDRVVQLGRVDDAVMPGLVAGAGAVVVPSLYEGFGLPALEAMAAGSPLVASNTSSLPEVVGDAGILTDPTPEGLASGLEAVTSGDANWTRMIAAGRVRARQFTWDRSAKRHAQVWRSLS